MLFFFFKQKTAYEMRISDWSSDVCSSDLDDDLLGIYRADIIEAHSVAASIFELDDGRHELVEFLDGIRGEKFIAQHADAFVELAGGVGLVRVDLEDELLAFVEFDIGMRSEERRLGKGGVRTCRYRWLRNH